MLTGTKYRQLSNHNNPKGSALLSLVIALALVVVLIGGGYLVWTLYIGANNELQNASTAGALNVAKQVPTGIDCPINMNDPYERQLSAYADVVDGQPVANLNNFNKIEEYAAKYSMRAVMFAKMHGDPANAGYANAQKLADAANNIAQRLADAINKDASDPNGKIAHYFKDVFDANSHRMAFVMGKSTPQVALTVKPAYINPGKFSNIALHPVFANPPSPKVSMGSYVQIPGSTLQQAAKSGIPGYVPIRVAFVDKTFWFLPFSAGDRPRLVSASAYEAGKNPPSDKFSNCPLPNAFLITPKISMQSNTKSIPAITKKDPNQIIAAPIILSPILIAIAPISLSSLLAPVVNSINTECIRLYNGTGIDDHANAAALLNSSTLGALYSNLSVDQYLNDQILTEHVAGNDPCSIYSNTNHTPPYPNVVNTFSGWVSPPPTSRSPLLTYGILETPQSLTVGQALTELNNCQLNSTYTVQTQAGTYPNYQYQTYGITLDELATTILTMQGYNSANYDFTATANIAPIVNRLLSDQTPFPMSIANQFPQKGDVYVFIDTHNTIQVKSAAFNNPGGRLPTWIQSIANNGNNFLTTSGQQYGFLNTSFFANIFTTYSWWRQCDYDCIVDFWSTPLSSGGAHSTSLNDQNVAGDWGLTTTNTPYSTEPTLYECNIFWDRFYGYNGTTSTWDSASNMSVVREVVFKSFLSPHNNVSIGINFNTLSPIPADNTTSNYTGLQH